jgi:hypothetical protein
VRGFFSEITRREKGGRAREQRLRLSPCPLVTLEQHPAVLRKTGFLLLVLFLYECHSYS